MYGGITLISRLVQLPEESRQPGLTNYSSLKVGKDVHQTYRKLTPTNLIADFGLASPFPFMIVLTEAKLP